jgi:transcription initiation factor IIE alpha subunit
MSNTEILDKIGKTVVEKVYDESLSYFRALRAGTTKWGIGKEYTDVLNKLSESDKDILYKLHESTINTAIFSFMQIFEDHPEFKIVYEENGRQVDLNKISEMLKAEHHSWIKRFSQELKNESPR